MKKENRNGRISIKSDREEKFINMNAAIKAAQMMQLNMTQQGYLTTSYYNPEINRLEVTVHFSDKAFPTIFCNFKSTWHEVTSHEFWSEIDERTVRCRCLTYYFEY